MKVAILDDYQNVAERAADWSAVRARAEITVFAHHLGGIDAVAAALKDFEIISAMRERTAFPRALFARLPKLKLLCITGPFTNNLDLAAANDHGVTVVATAGSIRDNPAPGTAWAHYSTPELTWALIMGVTRNIGREDRALHAGRWQHTMGRVLRGRTLGIVGLGNIGAMVAAYGKAFGMNVIAWSPRLTDARAAAGGAMRVDKHTLFAESDVVSVHMKPAPSTFGLVGKSEFALMKPDAVIVNTSRGPIIDEAAMIDALQSGRIAGAALDVFDQEPLPAEHPLRRLENTLLTPHIGYVTEEHYRIFYGQTVENILAFLDGHPIRTINATGVISTNQ
jgi:phosphoglycerate dehydrogenase-like enzyme